MKTFLYLNLVVFYSSISSLFWDQFGMAPLSEFLDMLWRCTSHLNPYENQTMKNWKHSPPPPSETQAGEYEVIIPAFPSHVQGGVGVGFQVTGALGPYHTRNFLSNTYYGMNVCWQGTISFVTQLNI